MLTTPGPPLPRDPARLQDRDLPAFGTGQPPLAEATQPPYLRKFMAEPARARSARATATGERTLS